MEPCLKGKVAVITGSGDGIGRGVAMAMSVEGASVVVNDIAREPDGKNKADSVVEEIKKAGGKAVANYDSVTTIKGGENIIGTAIDKFRGIDILVNCAGNFSPLRSFEVMEEDWDSIINVHLKGHYNCVKAAIVEMIKQKSGRIINIASRAASGGGGNIAYSAAKAGILGFTSALANDLAEFGITVNAILPSAETKLFPGKRPEEMMGGLPVGLFMEPEYVAPIIVYLATDEAQSITNRYIYACGGDLCIYPRPLDMPTASPTIIRNMGKWTIEKLREIIPPLIG